MTEGTAEASVRAVSGPLPLRAALLAALAAASQGCEAGYLLKQARGQVRILWNREPVEEVLARPDLPAETRRKLELARDVRRFAEETLGLEAGDNYASYYDVGGPSVSYALAAAPKDALEPVTWRFPIVGEVPYLGFFEKEDALARKRELEAEGFDVYLRGVPAYSTLGWFADPLFSTMLAMEDANLANTIVHELTHATLFIPGSVEFNENLATFVGNRGAALYFEARDGKESPRAREVAEDFEDAQRFGAFLKKTIEELKAYYAVPRAREERIAGREAEFARIQARYRAEVLPLLKGKGYRAFGDASLNNALILALGAYHADLTLFERAAEGCGGSLKLLMRGLAPLRDEEGDPAEALARRLENGPPLCPEAPGV